jgi:two-component system phosphate regulon response regulator OmpR
MSRRQHLFLVEDDHALRGMLADYFVTQGVELTVMASTEEMFLRIGERPDLVVLDIALPGMSGLEACQRLRRQGDHTPIIFLSARTDPVDRIVGLEMGADDYVNKPFSARELLARARAVLRRGPAGATATTPEADRSVRIGEWTFLPASRSLHRGQEVRVLSTVEYALLAELTARPGLPVTREHLLNASHANKDSALLRAVDASIMRLRRLVEIDPSNPRYIQTVRFHGYMFVPHLTLASE